MVTQSRRVLVGELARYDRLLEVGVGTRPGVARALADRGHDVVAVDVTDGVDRLTERSFADADGSLLFCRADVVALSTADDPLAMCTDPMTHRSADVSGFDAVYGLNLPAELQRPTASLADRIDADCLFTTLGFEEPVVPVERRSLGGTMLYATRESPRGL